MEIAIILRPVWHKPKDKEEIDKIIEDYIDFYINKRISISLNGLTPKQYYDNYIKNTLIRDG